MARTKASAKMVHSQPVKQDTIMIRRPSVTTVAFTMTGDSISSQSTSLSDALHDISHIGAWAGNASTTGIPRSFSIEMAASDATTVDISASRNSVIIDSHFLDHRNDTSDIGAKIDDQARSTNAVTLLADSIADPSESWTALGAETSISCNDAYTDHSQNPQQLVKTLLSISSGRVAIRPFANDVSAPFDLYDRYGAGYYGPTASFARYTIVTRRSH